MEIIESSSDRFVIAMSVDEMAILSNAINETLEHLPDWEMHIRTGADRTELEALQRILNHGRGGIA
ncbi:MAG: hypothetical protein ACNA8P_09155 [Phycisphaerales bacterium]